MQPEPKDVWQSTPATKLPSLLVATPTDEETLMTKDDFGLAGYALMLSLLDNLEKKSVITREDSRNIVQQSAELLEQLGKTIWFLGTKRSAKILLSLLENADKANKEFGMSAKN